jgi:hypothetical protein
MCSQIWLSPLVDDPNPPGYHKFEKANTSLKQPFLYIGKFLPKSDLKFLKIKIKWFQLPEVRKHSSEFMISIIIDFPMCSQKI